ncbi:MAG: ABC transporter permease [Coriobacteriia bacterium]|nr:ABC transporter permease [Coriobacteriia bacterium]
MNKILAMLRVSVLQIVRDRGELFSMLFLPLLLTYVFGVAFGSGGADRPVLVAWLEGDSSTYAVQVRELVDSEDALEVSEVSRDEAERMLADGESSIIVQVPDGFGADIESGRPASVLVEQEPGSTRGQAALEVVQGAVARVNANVQAARIAADVGAPEGVPGTEDDFSDAYAIADSLWEPEPPIGVTGAVVTESDVRGDNVLAASNVQYSAGFTIMFVLFMAFGSAGGILEEREQGTLRRLVITPSTRAELLAGKITGVIGTSAIEAFILVGFGALVFSVPWGRDPLALIVVLGAYVLAAAGLAVLVTAVVRTRGQLSAIGPVAATGLSMLGGCYWPIEVTPPFMQTIAKFTPTGWAMSGLLDVVARGQGLEAALLPAGMLLGMAGIFFAGGLAFLKIE